MQSQEDGERSSCSAVGTILGTITDMEDAPVSGATIILEGIDSSDVLTAQANDNGFYEIGSLIAGRPYHVVVHANGFAKWESPEIILGPGESKILDVGKLRIEEVQTNITVTPEDSEEVAAEQVKEEESQRGFLIIPNFYAVYNPNAKPLTAKLKFKLASRVAIDPFTLTGANTLAGIDQATHTSQFSEGSKGYGERLAASYGTALTDIMLDGAILPSLLHQDPRYFYQGTGTTRSRVAHVISSLFIAKGDNGRWQPNYSSIGGDLASAGISNLYYPRSSRGAGLVLRGFAVNTAVHLAVRMLDEFVFRPPTADAGTGTWNSNPHL